MGLGLHSIRDGLFDPTFHGGQPASPRTENQVRNLLAHSLSVFRGANAYYPVDAKARAER